jgi:hypothetical protein
VIRRAALVLVALAVAAAGAQLSTAAFTSGADEAPATFQVGRLAISAAPGTTSTTTLDTTNMRPGQTRSGTIAVRDDGTVDARTQLAVRLDAPSPLADVLRLRVEDCADAACTTPAPRFEAALTGVGDQPLGPVAAGTARTYRISVIWPADKADPALQGATASLTLVFTALAGTSA